MLVAVTQDRRRIVATAAARAAGPLCPDCAQALVVREPRARVAHFAHRPHSGCVGRQQGRRVRGLHVDEVYGQQALFDV